MRYGLNRFEDFFFFFRALENKFLLRFHFSDSGMCQILDFKAYTERIYKIINIIIKVTKSLKWKIWEER